MVFSSSLNLGFLRGMTGNFGLPISGNDMLNELGFFATNLGRDNVFIPIWKSDFCIGDLFIIKLPVARRFRGDTFLA